MGKLAFDQEMMEVRTDFVESQSIRRSVKVVGQTQDGSDVALDGALGKLPQFHLPNHALTQRGHDGLLEQNRLGGRHAPNERALTHFGSSPPRTLPPPMSPQAFLPPPQSGLVQELYGPSSQ